MWYLSALYSLLLDSRLTESPLAAFVNVIECKVLFHAVFSIMHPPLCTKTYTETHTHKYTCTPACPWVSYPPPVQMRAQTPPVKTVILQWTPSLKSHGCFILQTGKLYPWLCRFLPDFRQLQLSASWDQSPKPWHQRVQQIVEISPYNFSPEVVWGMLLTWVWASLCAMWLASLTVCCSVSCH